GDPHLFVRAGKRLAGGGTIGAQLGLWVPGKDAPSIVAAAISADARALGTFPVGPGQLSVTAGFRLDNSDRSVDNVMKLSAQDRVSLGVSSFHAVLAGASYTVTRDRRWFGLEASTDVFVGSGAPSPIVRGGADLGLALSDQFSALVFVEVAKVPGLSYVAVAAGDVVLIPYEPIVTGGLALQARFGGPARGTAGGAGTVVRNDHPARVEVIAYAEASGEVVDDAGKPVIGARVTVKLKNATGSAVTDDQGAWKVAQLPIGKTVDGATTLDDTGAELTIEVDGKKPATSTLTLARGGNVVGKVALEAMLPPGQLRAIVKMVGTGKPIIGATVKIEPGGQTATSDADGKFQIDLPPGIYKITVSAPGLAAQQLDVTIDPNGVAIKNIDLHK
ncbi:MAG: carboxypeptidase regulatory-like domain-containing protein, partial [Proteobacteria bacterium]|nr:carboxypeptidase regulatory-like domain-containing protein [Pseudomonadota bacterium]